jgi:hypothetical protein
LKKNLKKEKISLGIVKHLERITGTCGQDPIVNKEE